MITLMKPTGSQKVLGSNPISSTIRKEVGSISPSTLDHSTDMRS